MNNVLNLKSITNNIICFYDINGNTSLELNGEDFYMSSGKSGGICTDDLICSFTLTKSELLQFTNKLM